MDDKMEEYEVLSCIHVLLRHVPVFTSVHQYTNSTVWYSSSLAHKNITSLTPKATPTRWLNS